MLFVSLSSLFLIFLYFSFNLAVFLVFAQLGDDLFQPPGDRYAQGAEVLQNAQAFVGDVEEDHRRAQRLAGATQQSGVQQVAHPDDQKDQHFFEDPLEAPGTGEPALLGGGQHPSEIVDDDKGGQTDQKAVPAAEGLTENRPDEGPAISPDGQSLVLRSGWP